MATSERARLEALSALQHKRQQVSSRRAARRGRAKTKVLFDELDCQVVSSGGESSRASSCSAEEKGKRVKEGEPASTSSLASFKASARPPGPPFRPAPAPPPPLPKGIISVCLTTVPPVQIACKPPAHESPSRKPQALAAHTPPSSPTKKTTFAPQIPTQGPVPNTEQAKEVDQVVFEKLVHLPKDALSSGVLNSWVVLYNPQGTSESQFSQPKALFEPPPSLVAPRSFMFKYFAEQVDKMPDED